MFRCNVPPALLAEWLGSFTCHCSNMGVKWTLNKNQHTELTLEKKILLPPLSGFKLATFWSRVRRFNQQANWAPQCEHLSRNSLLWFDWLVWTSVWRWCHVALLKLNWPCTCQCAMVIPPFCFYCLMSGVNVKYIYQRVGGTQLLVGSHQSNIHKWNVLKWQHALYW